MNTHTPVLLEEVKQQIQIEPNSVIVDGTVGHGGHARALSELLDKDGWFVGFDLDGDALKIAKKLLSNIGTNVTLIEDNIKNIVSVWNDVCMQPIDVFFLDLGWGSHHLRCGRGFSFQMDEPLILSYATDSSKQMTTGAEIINSWSRSKLTDLFREYGEESQSSEYAKAIVKARKKSHLLTSGDLARVIESVSIYHGRIHPATRIFQALRIAVNDEIGVLKSVLKDIPHLLSEKAQVCIISFHSIEDRIVKQIFKQWEKEGGGIVKTKKPICPSWREKKKNPRARSAKLRLFANYK